MFYSIKELVTQASSFTNVAALMISTEAENTGRSPETIRKLMGRNLDVMRDSISQGIAGVKSVTGLTGGDAKRLDQYLDADTSFLGPVALAAVRNAVAVNEVNAKMGLICATPTAGSAGVVAGCLMAVTKPLGLTRDQQIDFLFTAGAFGLVIANNAGIAGAEGGCQAEVGSAAAMAAAALVQARGGDADMAAQAVAITIANLMGLVCDPVAGLVEVPCVKRNAMGAAQAMTSADMALAGLRSVIPPDEVIAAMDAVGKQMPSAFRETGEGGLAATATGQTIRRRIFGD